MFKGLAFYIPRCPERKEVTELIEQHKGTCVSKCQADVLQLVPHDMLNKMPKGDHSNVMSLQFIYDSVAAGKVLSLTSYLPYKEPKTKPSGSNELPKASPKSRKPYTEEERTAMRQFVKANPQLSATGMSIWKLAEEAQITSHSHQSMLNHYKNYIVGERTPSPVKKKPVFGFNSALLHKSDAGEDLGNFLTQPTGTSSPAPARNLSQKFDSDKSEQEEEEGAEGEDAEQENADPGSNDGPSTDTGPTKQSSPRRKSPAGKKKSRQTGPKRNARQSPPRNKKRKSEDGQVRLVEKLVDELMLRFEVPRELAYHALVVSSGQFNVACEFLENFGGGTDLTSSPAFWTPLDDHLVSQAKLSEHEFSEVVPLKKKRGVDKETRQAQLRVYQFHGYKESLNRRAFLGLTS